jgi:hypothetical protein
MNHPLHHRLPLALGAIVLASGAALAGDLKPEQVARQLAGDWQGQMHARANDQLSASMASMKAVRRDGDRTLEIHYESFAFGKPAQGAMILSFDRGAPSLSVRDPASRTSNDFFPARGFENAGDQAMVMAGRSDDSRAVFSREGHNAWNIRLEQRDKDNVWVPVLAFQLDRLPEGRRSAAAESFRNSPQLRALRRDRAIASVPTD